MPSHRLSHQASNFNINGPLERISGCMYTIDIWFFGCALVAAEAWFMETPLCWTSILSFSRLSHFLQSICSQMIQQFCSAWKVAFLFPCWDSLGS